MIYWAQDFRRISQTPSPVSIRNAAKFCTSIEAARQRARVRNHSLEESDSLGKAVYTGKLKVRKYSITWSRALKKYLSTVLCQDGVPHSYVVRDSEEPDYTIKSQPDYEFELLLINCVPLTGLTYKTYSRRVHQIIHGFVQGKTSEIWINPK